MDFTTMNMEYWIKIVHEPIYTESTQNEILTNLRKVVSTSLTIDIAVALRIWNKEEYDNFAVCVCHIIEDKDKYAGVNTLLMYSEPELLPNRRLLWSILA